MTLTPFHLAFPVTDLVATRTFYEEVLRCIVGRTSERWIDFDFFGHQCTAHLVDDAGAVVTNDVDGHQVAARHFGPIVDWETWHALRDRLMSAGVEFVVGPYVRFEGQVGEQATMFFRDPSGNHIEIKGFKNLGSIFSA